MQKYIDFDGVVLDTWEITHARLLKLGIDLENEDLIIDYIMNSNWEELLRQAKEIKSSLLYLKQMDPSETAILTKVHSLDEATAKVHFVREKEIKLPVVIVPFETKKTEVVEAKNSILVDDSVRNLDDWQDNDGMPYFFNKNENSLDDWHIRNIDYPVVRSLKRFVQR